MSNPILIKSVQIFTNPRGQHSPDNFYTRMDEVQYQTSLYVASEDIPVGTPITDTRWICKIDNSEAWEAEQSRIESESSRGTSESTRNTNEQTRTSNEETRQTQEGTRQTNEGTRQSQEGTRQENEQLRVEAENVRPRWWTGTQAEYDELPAAMKDDEKIFFHIIDSSDLPISLEDFLLTVAEYKEDMAAMAAATVAANEAASGADEAAARANAAFDTVSDYLALGTDDFGYIDDEPTSSADWGEI